jgi:hypothetical protein
MIGWTELQPIIAYCKGDCFFMINSCFRISDLSTETAQQKEEMERMKEKINWEETQRRKLHNMVQELKVIL